ncbi:MAG: alanine--tRNA ligase [Candidatus Campbellbacteria bacterium]|nr:alanine--tRNA ligase [Candidatus Campbellbacteria bacterium]
MKTAEVRKRYLDFFASKGHRIVPSASLVPTDDPTTLFTGSGMQPMVPYLLGEDHPLGSRIVDSQKCFRAEDIEEIGDNRHTTFFEMLGNWSLGDYFKEEQLSWLFEFLTDKEAGLGLDPERLYITVFHGDKNNDLPKDTESVEIWKSLFKQKNIEANEVEVGTEENGSEIGLEGGRIFYYDASKNWWSRGGTPDDMPVGEPGGPDSEVFYEFQDVEHDPAFGKKCHPNCDCGRFLEIGNSVFMQYVKKAEGHFEKLPKENVDFGGGLERLTAVTEDFSDIFKIDVLRSIIERLEDHSGERYENSENKNSFRVIADHIRGAVFMISDGVTPSNSERGYFVRRLIRRSIRHANLLGIETKKLKDLVSVVANNYREVYPEVFESQEWIQDEIESEESKFKLALDRGLKEFRKIIEKEDKISGKGAFKLFTTHGFPFELTEELAREYGKEVDKEAFEEEYRIHQEESRKGADKKFKGGLGDTGEMSVKYHTATHLLNAALRDVLGEHVEQKGSNITPERLRFDFSHSEKLTEEEKKEIETFVNGAIERSLPVSYSEMTLEEARAQGAVGVFEDKYEEKVRVYKIGDRSTGVVSLEICGGPHVENTGELGKFRIKKEEASSAGVRRIKAILE